MSDIVIDKYSSLLTYIENGCLQINEERDFVTYLKSMEQAESIEEMIGIFDNIYKLLAVIIFNSKNLSQYWYIYEFWAKSEISIVEKLFDFLNENILKWLEKQEKPTKEQCKKCLVNLREGRNTLIIQNEILAIAGEKVSIEGRIRIENRNALFSIRKKIDNLNRFKEEEKYNALMKDYKRLSCILADNGHVYDIIECLFAKQHDIDYESLLVQYKEEQNRLKEIAEVEQKKKEKEERKRKIGIIIWILLSIIVIIGLMYLFSKIGIFGIILIIGISGALLSYLK